MNSNYLDFLTIVEYINEYKKLGNRIHYCNGCAYITPVDGIRCLVNPDSCPMAKECIIHFLEFVVKKNYKHLMDIPGEYQTQLMCDLAIEQSLEAYHYVKMQLRERGLNTKRAINLNSY